MTAHPRSLSASTKNFFFLLLVFCIGPPPSQPSCVLHMAGYYVMTKTRRKVFLLDVLDVPTNNGVVKQEEFCDEHQGGTVWIFR